MPEQTSGAGGPGFFGRVWAQFGEVARKLGIVHEHDVNEALEHQETTRPRKKLGEILVEKGKMTDDHVAAVLKEQQSPSVKAEAAAIAAETVAPTQAAAAKAVKKPPRKSKKKAAKKPKKKAAKKSKKKAAKKKSRS
jgi:hypothetical protein